MSGVLVESVPVTGETITVPASGDSGDTYSYTLFTVNPSTPSRIDGVAMQLVYPGETESIDQFELTLQAKNGAVLWRQPTAALNQDGSILGAYLTWGFGGNDTAQASFAVGVSTLGKTVWADLPLPPIVLQEEGMVGFNVYRASDGGLGEIDITNINISYTPLGAATDTSGTNDILPLLVPTSTG